MAIMFEATRGCLPKTDEVLTHPVYGKQVRNKLVAVARRLGVNVLATRGLGDVAVMIIDPLCGFLVVDHLVGSGPRFRDMRVFRGPIGRLRLDVLDRRAASLLANFPFRSVPDLISLTREVARQASVIELTAKDFQGPEAIKVQAGLLSTAAPSLRRELVAI